MGSFKSLGDFGPVNDLPDFFHEVWSDIHIVKIVCMLPNINGENGHEVSALVAESVLVGSGAELEVARGLVVR